MLKNLALSLILALTIINSGFALDSKWKEDANTQIEKTRKSNAIISITDSEGKPLPAANLEIKQTGHAFVFGGAVNSNILRNQQYQEYFVSHFNMAVFENETKWYSHERSQGSVNYSQSDSMYEWLAGHDIPVRGHAIFWEPEKWQTNWVMRMDANDLRKAIDSRLESVVTHYKDKFVHWDVDNEMIHGSFFVDRLGEDIQPYMFKKARELDPNVKLFVNEFNILSIDQNFEEVQLDEYIAHIKSLLDRGAPIDCIGVQGHVFYDDITVKPHIIKERLDKIAALGKPIWITEFDVADANQTKNADTLEIIYRTAFAHPSVEGVICWVFWEGASWRGANAGWMTRNWQPKETGKRFDALMDEWTTETTGVTSTNGELTFRGFQGEYEVTITKDGSTPVTKTFKLETGSNEPQKISLKIE